MKYVFSFIVCIATEASAQKISLFNGRDLSGWHMDVPAMDTNASAPAPFIVREGRLVSLSTPGGHIITDSVYENYELELAYRFVGKPGNNGILVHASTPRRLYKMFPQSIEVQLMHENAGDFWVIGEDISVTDMEKRRGPKQEWGVDGNKKRRIENLTDNSEKPVGEWNLVRVQCKGDEIRVWINGDLVNHGYDCTATRGAIALQAEGSEVEFRDITLTKLK